MGRRSWPEKTVGRLRVTTVSTVKRTDRGDGYQNHYRVYLCECECGGTCRRSSIALWKMNRDGRGDCGPECPLRNNTKGAEVAKKAKKKVKNSKSKRRPRAVGRLARLIAEERTTREEAAESIGLSTSGLCRWLSGDVKRPTPAKLAALKVYVSGFADGPAEIDPPEPVYAGGIALTVTGSVSLDQVRAAFRHVLDCEHASGCLVCSVARAVADAEWDPEK